MHEHIKDSQKSLHPSAKRKSKTRSSSILSVAVGRNTNLLVLSKSLVEEDHDIGDLHCGRRHIRHGIIGGESITKNLAYY